MSPCRTAGDTQSLAHKNPAVDAKDYIQEVECIDRMFIDDILLVASLLRWLVQKFRLRWKSLSRLDCNVLGCVHRILEAFRAKLESARDDIAY